MGSRNKYAKARRAALATAAFLAVVVPASAQQQEPSWTDRVGDFFNRLRPGGGPPEQPAQQPPAQTGQPGTAQAPVQSAPLPPAQAQQAPARGKSTPAQAQQAPARGAAPATAQQAQQAPAQPAAAQAQQAPAEGQQAQPQPAQAEAPPARRAPSLTDRIGDFFNRLRPGADAPEPAPRAAGAPDPEDFDCPIIDIREGASTLMVQGQSQSGEQGALSLRYQASFVRAARECIVKGKDVTIKVGVQGRVILGPAGGAGDLKIPLRYALVEEELGRTKMIWSKLYIIPVTVPDQQPNVEFKHVEEDMTVPIPNPDKLENYMVYIGFDPNGLPPEPRKSPPPKKKPPA